MSRGWMTPARPYAVWLAVTSVAGAAAWSVPVTWHDAARGAGPDRLSDVLVAGCATMLAVSLGWLWLVASVTVAELVTGSVLRGGGATRRLVLLACGAAVVATTALPAQASAGDGAEVLVGLPLPERTAAPAGTVAGTEPPTTSDAYVVRADDSLWSIARAHPAPGAGVEARWRSIWRHNRDVVGADPDLIHPGQVLHLPGTDTDEDGERR
jgi:LysM repeat protein